MMLVLAKQGKVIEVLFLQVNSNIDAQNLWENHENILFLYIRHDIIDLVLLIH